MEYLKNIAGNFLMLCFHKLLTFNISDFTAKMVFIQLMCACALVPYYKNDMSRKIVFKSQLNCNFFAPHQKKTNKVGFLI